MNEAMVAINTSNDVVAARQQGRALAAQLGFGSADQTRLATAISELTRNVVQYAGTGRCVIRDESDTANLKIRVIVEDHGPGIADVDKAMTEGYSTSGSLGAGLPGTKRLVHEFDLKSQPGHTVVEIAMSRLRRR